MTITLTVTQHKKPPIHMPTHISIHDTTPTAYISPAIHLIDLPGYGFAKVSKKDQREWSNIMSAYLSTRGFLALRRVLVLIDARRGPQEGDWRLMELLSQVCCHDHHSKRPW